MCTVTFLPLNDSILLTSNRDEHVLREPAVLPEAYNYENGKILFPKDGRAGGTWIGLHNNGNAMILLNGAFKKHKHEPPYRRSRGLIFLDIFDSTSPVTAFQETALHNIEPFTLVIWQQNELWEARWDGTENYLTPLPTDVPRIWSSATLYDDEMTALRKEWFNQWLKTTRYKTAERIRLFHEFGGDADESINLRMNRNGILRTVSITGIELLKNKAVMHYKDMQAGLLSVNEWYIGNLLQHT